MTKKTKFDNIEQFRDQTWINPDLPLFSKIKYGGSDKLPNSSDKILRSWPMYEFDINENNELVEKGTNIVIECIFIINI